MQDTAATYSQFNGYHCESCESDEPQPLRCGEVTAWHNFCRVCWNTLLPSAPHWELDE